MLLKGSCHCGSVRFQFHSAEPYSFNVCYCSICRKTAGGGGYAINLGGDHSTFKVEGKQYINVYQARIADPATGETKRSEAQRNFCSKCGSALWVWDPGWPEAGWVEVHAGPRDQKFDAYPKESLAAWHERLGLKSADS